MKAGSAEARSVVEQIARVCHETNRAYCESIGDMTQKPWDDAEEWQRQSAIAGVNYAVNNPKAPASAQHEAWLQDKQVAGWKYGPVKNTDKKEHPCMVPYSELPMEQRMKDHLFRAVVKAFLEGRA
jgi:hypothetical protein